MVVARIVRGMRMLQDRRGGDSDSGIMILLNTGNIQTVLHHRACVVTKNLRVTVVIRL
jgi:hypothetical protein